jgi:hypothetical protein
VTVLVSSEKREAYREFWWGDILESSNFKEGEIGCADVILIEAVEDYV